jgi:tRNA(fMet)-specific endonuclease VapC
VLLLDTNIWIAFLKRDEEVRARLRALPANQIALCSVVKAELLYGARKSKRVNENLKPLEALFGLYESPGFDDAAAHWYGRVRAQLEREGQVIGGNDLMIAAIALASDATVVTRNEREFRRVPGLRVESW